MREVHGKMRRAVPHTEEVRLDAISKQRCDIVQREPHELAVRRQGVELVEGQVARAAVSTLRRQPFGITTEIRGAVEGVAGERDRFVHRTNLTALWNKRGWERVSLMVRSRRVIAVPRKQRSSSR